MRAAFTGGQKLSRRRCLGSPIAELDTAPDVGVPRPTSSGLPDPAQGIGQHVERHAKLTTVRVEYVPTGIEGEPSTLKRSWSSIEAMMEVWDQLNKSGICRTEADPESSMLTLLWI